MAEAIRQLREMDADLWSVDRRMQLMKEACLTTLQAVYIAAGYEFTGHRNWKRRTKMDQANSTNNTIPPRTAGQPSHRLHPDNLTEAVQAAKTGDLVATSWVSQILDHNPSLIEHYGDLSVLTRGEWIKRLSAGDIVVRMAMLKRANQRLIELAGEEATASEILMANRVVIAEMQMAFYERLEAINADKMQNTKYLEWVVKRQDAAKHQFSQAVTQLKKVQILEREITRRRPASAQAIRIYNPDAKTSRTA